VAYAKDLLNEVGLGEGRLEMAHIDASDAPLWAETVREMTDRIRALGPNPIRMQAASGDQKTQGKENIEYRTRNDE